jgi:hypothetical protein
MLMEDMKYLLKVLTHLFFKYLNQFKNQKQKRLKKMLLINLAHKVLEL